MPLSQKEIRERAVQFSLEWAHESRERAEAQTFWNEFFNVFGITRRRVAAFEQPVAKLHDEHGSIDLLWKGTLLVEHKSKGESLDKAYSQALDYFPGLKDEELPKYVLVSDFARFRLYDLEQDTHDEFSLAEFPKRLHLFGFISGYRKRTYKDEDPVNIAVAEKMGDLHDSLLRAEYKGHELERFLVRLVYCLFADDTGIFAKDQFHFYLETNTKADGSDTGAVISTIFQTLNLPYEKRQKTLPEELLSLPHVNGELFAEGLLIPSFDRHMREMLLECCQFDWSTVSPAIFGSLFQAVMSTDKVKRHSLGGHYTSEKNILKVVRGLFLDELYEEFESIKHDERKLKAFRQRLAAMRFFDPACGCGNFLIITYREMRRLEIEVLKRIRELGRDEQLFTDVRLLSLIDVDSMYGIEIEEFPARIAEVALWLTDHQMNMQLSAEFGKTLFRLPLERSARIVNDNSLRVDWSSIVPRPNASPDGTQLFILGNPPFVSKKSRTTAQNEDMAVVFRTFKNYGVLDYVTAWYVKAADFIQGTDIKVAFVSTNSITQGEQVGVLWPYLLSRGNHIFLGHRTFKWTNEARGKAAVFCVIIGFANSDLKRKRLYDYETPISGPMEIAAKNINPYLVDAGDIIVTSRTKPISNVPKIRFGSMPNDGGYLLLSESDRADLLKREPRAGKFIRQLLGSVEYLNGIKRYCLWLENASPHELRSLPLVLERVEEVAEYRRKSKRATTRGLAKVPTLFGENRQPKTRYILLPSASSERRKYVPLGFVEPDVIASNLCLTIAGADLYHFGVLSSAMHMAWLRDIGGRLKGDYRYSNNIVYNNFPWPEEPSAQQKKRITDSAETILNERSRFPDATPADLYDPRTMPKGLLHAHTTLDAVVDACYRPAPFKTQLERTEFLLNLYRKITEPLGLGSGVKKRVRVRKKTMAPTTAATKTN